MLLFLFCFSSVFSQMDVSIPPWAMHHSHRYQMNSSLGFHPLQGITKAQEGEDALAYTRYFCGVQGGRYLEMGALDGHLYSNTYALEKAAGWKGILIEANPTSFRSLKANRPDNILIHAAICAKTQLVHYIDKGNPCCTGIFEFMSEAFVKAWHANLDLQTTTVVNCHPMAEVLRIFPNMNHINLFSLDVEGAEYEVLRSLDFKAVKFDLIVVEADRSNVAKDTQVMTLLESNGYSFIANEVRSDWYKRSDWKPTPC